MNNFSKNKRLLDKPQFDRVFSKAKKVFFPEFLILFRNRNDGEARIGLAVSKKTVNKATARNRCKRLVRESFRTNQLPNVDMIFLSRRGLANLSNTQLNSKLTLAWQKIANIHEKKLIFGVFYC